MNAQRAARDVIQAQAQMTATQNVASVGAAGHAPWKCKQSRAETGAEVWTMWQDPMKLAIMYHGEPRGDGGLKLWTESRGANSWNAMMSFSQPNPINLRCTMDTTVGAILEAVKPFVYEDLQKGIGTILETIPPASARVSGRFDLQSCEIKDLVFEGETMNRTTKLSEFAESEKIIGFVHLKVVVVQTLPPRAVCCAIS